jgi:hypothetical protein
MASGVLYGCSPYVFSDQIQTLNTKVGAIDTAYQDTAQKILMEKHLDNRIKWIQERDKLASGLGCSDFSDNRKIDKGEIDSCDLLTMEEGIAKEKEKEKEKENKNEALASSLTDVTSVESIQIKGWKQKVQGLTSLQQTDILKAIDNYTSALVAITKAEDRTAFDNAAAKVSASVGGLLTSVGLVSGAGAVGAPAYGAIAKASSTALLYFVGQGLDYQRLHQLQISTNEASESIHILAQVIGDPILSNQRHKRLNGLGGILTKKVSTVNHLVDNLMTKKPPLTDSVYGAAIGPAIDEAQVTADAFETVRVTNPQKMAEALSKSHDDLVTAVNNNDGQFAALIISLQTFTQRVNELEQAAAAVATSKTVITNAAIN